MGILGTLLGKREPEVRHHTIDGGHPAPYPDMTDEQLYNYEVTFKVPERTFDKPPLSTIPKEKLRTEHKNIDNKIQPNRNEPKLQSSSPSVSAIKPLDLTKPVRLVTTKQSVEIITIRARHPLYKVHGYIGGDDVVTVFTLQGQLSENGPSFLENVPQRQQLYLNIYANRDPDSDEPYRVTSHKTKEAAEASAQAGRIAVIHTEFDQ